MFLHINPSDELPIYRQIVRQITDAIAGGQMKAGEKLPSHREMAAEVVVAPLTVKKAYDELEKAGLIETRRGLGTFVAESLPAGTRADASERLRDAARRIVTQARLAGLEPADLNELLQQVWEELDS
jgi:GntR family transcriptional regulator